MSRNSAGRFKNARDLLRWLFSFPAPIVIITGGMGKGKTDLALNIGWFLLQEGLVAEVATNIKVDAPGFRRITSVMELKHWLRTMKGHKLFILDEAAIHLDARNPLSRLNRELRHMAYLLRKFRAKLILVAQRAKDIEAAFRDTDLWLATIRKITKTMAEITTNPGAIHAIIEGIPRAPVEFDTYDVAPFDLGPGGVEFEPTSLEEKIAYLWGVKKLSLRAIAKEVGLSHQGVQDALRRFVAQMLAWLSKVKQSGEEGEGQIPSPSLSSVNGENGLSGMKVPKTALFGTVGALRGDYSADEKDQGP